MSTKYRILEQPSHSIFSKGWDSEFIPQYLLENGTWEYFYYVWETTTEWFFFTKTKGVNYHMYGTLQEAVDYLDKKTGKIKLPPTTKVHPYPIGHIDPEQYLRYMTEGQDPVRNNGI